MSLKVYLTKETQKNLELKNRQEKIIKILKENILENLLNKLIGLKNTEINLKQKIEECNKQQEEIEKIKTQVSQEVNLKNEIQRNYELHSNLRNQKLQDLENNKKVIETLKTKNSDLENKINILITQQQNAEKEKKEAQDKQMQLQNDIKAIQDTINSTQDALTKKKNETIETQEIKNLKVSLASSEIAESRNNLLEEIEQSKREEEKLQKQLEEEERELNEQLKQKKSLIGLDNIDKINLSEKEGSYMIQKIKEKIIQQINAKKKEKTTKIVYEEKKLVDDEKGETNLICYSCECNCHCDCNCWRIVVWKPTSLCDTIKDGKCLTCGHKTENHNRLKKYYRKYKKERILSPEKKSALDKEINKLEESLIKFSSISDKQKEVLKSKKQIEENKIRKMNKLNDTQVIEKDKYDDVKLK